MMENTEKRRQLCEAMRYRRIVIVDYEFTGYIESLNRKEITMILIPPDDVTADTTGQEEFAITKITDEMIEAYANSRTLTLRGQVSGMVNEVGHNSVRLSDMDGCYDGSNIPISAIIAIFAAEGRNDC